MDEEIRPDDRMYVMVGGRLCLRHGHVVPLPTGHKARCGGPMICVVCKEEFRLKEGRPPAHY